MREDLDEPVSVLAGYSEKDKKFRPLIVTWGGMDYRLGKVDFYHKTKKGATTLHHFSLADKSETTYFKLTFNSLNLHWTMSESISASLSEARIGVH